ncbi:hypothetical protein HanPSC8_Chr03g0134001 [Helianthus annuus]|nr:hypothetical protein HanPSC8_Chr03g0134001 [Helianthus annuus]
MTLDGNQTRTRWVNPKPDTFGTGLGSVNRVWDGFGNSFYFFRGFGTGLGFSDIPVYPTQLPDKVYPFTRLYTRYNFFYIINMYKYDTSIFYTYRYSIPYTL